MRSEIEKYASTPSYELQVKTGVGKTLVLRALEALRPGWTVDLEGLAGHRSSILGRVGLAPVGQKRFESRLAARARAGFPGPAVVLEGESRKVGDVVVPAAVWRRLCEGDSVELVAPTELRVRNLVADYLAAESNRPELAAQLPFLEQRLGARRYAGVLSGLLAERRDAELALLLLEHYYDPLYRRSEKEREGADRGAVARFDSSDPAACAAAIAAWVEARPAGR